jgi:hypothetical protein
MAESPESSAKNPAPAAPARDRLLVAAFWIWAALLVVATLAQLFRWQGVLDFIDVKNWFAR